MADYGAQNAITDNYGTELPQSQVEEQGLVAEKNAAKFSKTKEYQELKVYLEGRIQFYQAFLPDGRSVIEASLSSEDLGVRWTVANAIIAEFKAVLNAYENARQAVQDESKRQAS